MVRWIPFATLRAFEKFYVVYVVIALAQHDLRRECALAKEIAQGFGELRFTGAQRFLCLLELFFGRL